MTSLPHCKYYTDLCRKQNNAWLCSTVLALFFGHMGCQTEASYNNDHVLTFPDASSSAESRCQHCSLLPTKQGMNCTLGIGDNMVPWVVLNDSLLALWKFTGNWQGSRVGDWCMTSPFAPCSGCASCLGVR
jgi:hypothetical protein